MEFLSNFNNFLSSKEITIELWQFILFLVINSFCLLGRRFKLGLLASYCFVFYWGFIVNTTYFFEILRGKPQWLVIYAIFGFSMLIIFIAGALLEEKS
jgi:hypothetical protein